MNSAYLASIALISFYLGYRFYSRFVSDKIYGLDESLKTPAHEFEDGIEDLIEKAVWNTNEDKPDLEWLRKKRKVKYDERTT